MAANKKIVMPDSILAAKSMILTANSVSCVINSVAPANKKTMGNKIASVDNHNTNHLTKEATDPAVKFQQPYGR